MATAATVPVPHQASAPLSLMSCVRESSPQDLDSSTEMDLDKNAEPSKKRRFHPFRGLRKMFRRKVRHSGADENIPGGGEMLRQAPLESSCGTPNMDIHRSRSTSELLAADEPTRRMGSGALCNTNTGLSVSHDSVFTGEPQSGSDLELDTAQSSSSLSIQQLVLPGIRAELLDAVRRRRGRGDTSEDEEDLGLPRSPCNSPTTADILFEKSIKEHPTKSHSTCSDGSLLSMGSSEMDEDSYGMHSGHSSKGSLHDKPRLTNNFDSSENELELGYTETSAPLSHSAARHKMAVRPKRTHGAPRRRRVQQLTSGTSLPTTPEVNEEASARSVTPEVISKQEASAEFNKNAGMIGVVPPETRLKSASLPLGITSGSGYSHLSRSRSNAASVPQDSIGFPRSTSHDNELGKPNREVFSTVGEEDEDEKILNKDERKKEDSFFGRLLSRRSGKKKKEKVEEVDSTIVFKQKESVFNAMNIKKRFDEKGQYLNESSITSEYNITSKSNISKLPRSGPASRQRVEPIEIPASPETRLKKVGYTPPFLSNSPENKYIEGNQNKQLGDISSTNIHSTKSRFMNETQHLDVAEKSTFSHSQELLYSHKVYSKTVAEKSFTYDNSPPKSEFVKNVPLSTVKLDIPEEVELVKKVTVSYNESKSELSKKPPLPQTSSVELNTDNHNVTIASKTSNIHVQNIAVRSPTEHLNFFNNSPPSVDYHKKRMDSYMETCVNALNENRSMNKETIHPRQRRLDSYVTVEPPSLPQDDNFASEEESVKQNDDEYDKIYSNSFYSISPPKTNTSEQYVESDMSHLQQSVSYSKSPPKMNASENIYIKNQTSSKSYSSSPPKKISSQQQHTFTKNQQAISYVSPLRVNSSDMYSKKQSSKSRVSMSGLSSYQQKLSQFNETVIDKTDHDFASLNYYPDEYVSSFNVNPIVKSHSFKHKSEPIEKSHEMPSLPCHLYNNFSNKIDLTNKSNSSKQLINSEIEFSKSSSDLSFNTVKETDIQNPKVDKFDSKYKKSSMKKSSSLSNVNSADTKFMDTVKYCPYEVSSSIDASQDMIIEEKKSDVVINKPNTNKVDKMETSKLQKLSISSSDSSSSEIQASSKINVKRESRVVEKNGVPNVPEFLKIQLNKVDSKPTVNVVLSTNISNVEENKFPEVEIILQENNKVENEIPEIVSKRKFSKDDVEIFEKDDRKFDLSRQSHEEIEDVIKPDVSIGSQDSSRKTENANVRKISNISTSSTGSTHSTPGLKPQLRKKSSSLELTEPKKDAIKKQLSDGSDAEKIKEDNNQNDKRQNTFDNNQETVVLRKKSITAPKNDEEPELMKVFARRSLKLNGDSELLGQQVLVMLDDDNKRISNNVSAVTRKSRDSDKENETDSPHEERRKTSISHLTKDFPVKSKEVLVDSKVHVETSEITLKTSSFNIVKTSIPKLQKTGASSETVTSKENENYRINTENTIETKTEKTLHTVWSQIKRDRDIDITNKIETSKKFNNSNKNDIIDTKDNKNEETGEDFLPMFKRIQQRKEEWEKRAQQAKQQKNFP